MAERRPLVAIPARFSAGATALRSRAEVAARALTEAVWAAGGEPVVLHPANDGDAHSRLWFADAFLLPGGGDLAAHWYGQQAHPTLYDVDEEQDAFDLAVARLTLAEGLPLLAICRGSQVVNVALGGDLVQHMAEPHRHRVATVDVVDDDLRAIVGAKPSVSCYHHQCLGRLGRGLKTAATAADGTTEAIRLPAHRGWFLGVQWHPEDTAADDPAQAAVFMAFVRAARDRRPSCVA